MCSGYQYSVFHPENTGYFFNYNLVIAIYLKYINLMGGGGGGERKGGHVPTTFLNGGGGQWYVCVPLFNPTFSFST